MVHVRVSSPAAVDQSFPAKNCTNLHDGFLTIFTAAPRRRRECLGATLTEYLTHTVECPNIVTISATFFYHTSRLQLV